MSAFDRIGGAGGAAKSFNSPDLKTLRERLLTTVAASSAHLGKEEKRKRSGVLEDRPHLTSNFVIPAPGEPSLAACLRDVPPSSQESLLLQVCSYSLSLHCLIDPLQELLYCLVGNAGQHIAPAKGPHGRGVTFSLDPDIDPSLRSLLSRSDHWE